MIEVVCFGTKFEDGTGSLTCGAGVSSCVARICPTMFAASITELNASVSALCAAGSFTLAMMPAWIGSACSKDS
jgi:hypothetical protein